MSVYLDNAATTFPKPQVVADAVYAYMTRSGMNVGRGSYESAAEAENAVFETREQLASIFGANDCSNVAFTRNVTESLNLLLKGLLHEGDHVIVSSMEHNAVMRPLVQLQKRGVTFTRARCDQAGALVPGTLEECLQPKTKMVCMLHASNVTGTTMPLVDVGEFCSRHRLLFVVDTAQTAGLLPVDMPSMHIDAVAFTGHKGLLGPQGIGGVVLREGLAQKVEPLVAGGTGSISDRETIPGFMPDRLEAGTPNLPGIAGLHAALGWLEKAGPKTVLAYELGLTCRFLEMAAPLEAAGLVRICGRRGCEGRVGVVSLAIPVADAAQVAALLDERYGIMCRVGLHCAPSAHKTIGTFPAGTIRFSFGHANTEDEVDFAVNALEEILNDIGRK